MSRLDKGPLAGTEGHRPEYETIIAFGSVCLNNDLASIVEVNNICNARDAYHLDGMYRRLCNRSL